MTNRIELFIWSYGNKSWFRNKVFHRANGPAIVLETGQKLWYWQGQQLDEFNHLFLANNNKTNS